MSFCQEKVSTRRANAHVLSQRNRILPPLVPANTTSSSRRGSDLKEIEFKFFHCLGCFEKISQMVSVAKIS